VRTLKKLQVFLFGLMFFALQVAMAADNNADERGSEGNPEDEQPLIIDKSIPGSADEPVGSQGGYQGGSSQAGNNSGNNSGRGQPRRGSSVLNTKSGRLLDVLSRINQLEVENRQLRGEIEVLTHDLKSLKHRQRELYIDVDGRMRKIELKTTGTTSSSALSSGSNSSSTSTPPGPGSRPGPGGGPKGSPPVTAVGDSGYTPPTPNERQMYQRAFGQLRGNRYKRAIISFRAFLKKHPKGALSDNAQYWLAEALLVSRKYKSAIAEFNKLIKNFPKSPKVVSSKVKVGYAYYELRQTKKARRILRAVIKNYPNSSPAALAKMHLKRMKRRRK